MTTTAWSRRLLAGSAAALLLLAGCGGDDEPSGATATTVAVATAPTLDAALTDELQQIVDATVAEFGVPGAVVVVQTPDERWETAVGVRDLESGAPMEQGLRWPLRSITKSFTTTMVLQLADEGQLSLDDPISDWVDGVPNGDEVTLRQLGAMDAGLGDYTTEAWLDDFVADPGRQFTLDELIAYGLAEPPVAEPGDERVYTNLNTLLLGKVVEEVTGQPYDAALRERILEPLGLDDTVYPTDPSQWTTDVTGYQPDPDAPEQLTDQPVNYSVFGPAGALIATTDDLLRWGRALGSGELIAPEALDERHEGGELAEGPEYDQYAYGTGELEGWWGHTGEGFGHTVLVVHDAATDTTVAIGVNASQLERHVPTVLFRRLAPLLSGGAA